MSFIRDRVLLLTEALAKQITTSRYYFRFRENRADYRHATTHASRHAVFGQSNFERLADPHCNLRLLFHCM